MENSRNSISAFEWDMAQKRKSLPREEVRQAFRKEPSSGWEEECRCSDRRPWEEVGRLKLEALREEVHRFDGCDHTPAIDSSYTLCCTAAMQETQARKACE